VIGGVGYVVGPLMGAMLVAGGVGTWMSDTLLTSIDKYAQLIGGVTLILLLIKDPDGMASAVPRPIRRLLGPARKPGAPKLDGVEGHRVRPATLEVRGLTVRFGGVTAVDEVSLTVSPGQVVGLIGPNGAGKTTVIDAVSGFVRPAAGSVSLNGEAIVRWSVAARARAGLSRSFQGLELFEDVTVLENLRAASDDRDRGAYLSNLVAPRNHALPPAAVAAIREFGLEDDLDKLPGELPYSRRRLVAVARAVAVEPSILLLDEPAAGLDEHETLELGQLVRRLADAWGIAVLVVEHDMDFVMGLCDRITVLDFGSRIAEGTAAEVACDPAVITAYLGGVADEEQPGALLPIATRNGADPTGHQAETQEMPA